MALQENLVLILGAIFALAGATMFFFFRLKGSENETNRVEFFKVKMEVSAPSLVIFLVGCAMMVMAGPLFGEDGTPGQTSASESLSTTLGDQLPATAAQTTTEPSGSTPSEESEAGANQTSTGPYGAPSRQQGEATYMNVSSKDGSLRMQVPATWGATEEGIWYEGGYAVGNFLAASPDLEGFADTWTTPGILFGASTVLADQYTPSTLLDDLPMESWIGYSASCVYDRRDGFQGEHHWGVYDVWSNCNGVDSLVVTLGGAPHSGDYLAFLFVQVASEADLEALDRAMATFAADL